MGARGEPWRPISGTGTFDTFASCSMSLAVDKPKTSAVDGAETSPVDRAETSAADRAETPVVDKAETSAVDTAETSAVDETETLLLARQKVFCDQANTCAVEAENLARSRRSSGLCGRSGLACIVGPRTLFFGRDSTK